MASCTQIEGLVQAYIDGELGQSDRVIFDRHVGDCPVCASLFRKHQRSTAMLFEVFSEDRLYKDLSPAVLENLPELELAKQDMEGINWRAKHPAVWTARITRFVPAGVLLVLAVLGFIIREHWPAPLPGAGAIGIVTHVAGAPLKQAAANSAGMTCALEDYVVKGETYITGQGSTLILSMLGPTQVKLSEDSMLRVETDRRLSLEKGEICLDIGGEANLFKVFTPNGEITVFGTEFDVRVDGGETTVTVKRGRVTAENTVNVRSLSAGDRVVLPEHGEVSAVRTADVSAATRWADKLTTDDRAATLFENFLFSHGSQTELTAKAVYLFNTQREDGTSRAIKAITLSWDPDTNPARHCGYTVYVFDDAMQVLFRERVDGSVFDSHTQRSVELPAPGKPITGVKRLSVRLVPDYRTGDVETTFEKVTATAL